jgi:hypothetical protein
MYRHSSAHKKGKETKPPSQGSLSDFGDIVADLAVEHLSFPSTLGQVLEFSVTKTSHWWQASVWNLLTDRHLNVLDWATLGTWEWEKHIPAQGILEPLVLVSACEMAMSGANGQ